MSNINFYEHLLHYNSFSFEKKITYPNHIVFEFHKTRFHFKENIRI